MSPLAGWRLDAAYNNSVKILQELLDARSLALASHFACASCCALLSACVCARGVFVCGLLSRARVVLLCNTTFVFLDLVSLWCGVTSGLGASRHV